MVDFSVNSSKFFVKICFLVPSGAMLVAHVADDNGNEETSHGTTNMAYDFLKHENDGKIENILRKRAAKHVFGCVSTEIS